MSSHRVSLVRQLDLALVVERCAGASRERVLVDLEPDRAKARKEREAMRAVVVLGQHVDVLRVHAVHVVRSTPNARRAVSIHVLALAPPELPLGTAMRGREWVTFDVYPAEWDLLSITWSAFKTVYGGFTAKV